MARRTAMTLMEIEEATRPALISLDIYSAIFGTSRGHSYGLADDGKIPVIASGRLKFTPTAPIREQFGLPPVLAVAKAA